MHKSNIFIIKMDIKISELIPNLSEKIQEALDNRKKTAKFIESFEISILLSILFFRYFF